MYYVRLELSRRSIPVNHLSFYVQAAAPHRSSSLALWPRWKRRGVSKQGQKEGRNYTSASRISRQGHCRNGAGRAGAVARLATFEMCERKLRDGSSSPQQKRACCMKALYEPLSCCAIARRLSEVGANLRHTCSVARRRCSTPLLSSIMVATKAP